MNQLKYCQAPDCHTYFTRDRLKGQKGNKTNQTRRRSNLLFDEFCDRRCFEDWFRKYGTQAVNHFGRLKEVKHLTEENAWVKRYNYRGYENLPDEHYFDNTITKEQRPLTKQQYDDNTYTLNTGE